MDAIRQRFCASLQADTYDDAQVQRSHMHMSTGQGLALAALLARTHADHIQHAAGLCQRAAAERVCLQGL